jgi:signal recognition particle receptor subunit beta
MQAGGPGASGQRVVDAASSYPQRRAMLIDAKANEAILKVVYWGVGLCGKASNLQYVYERTHPDRRSKMVSVASEVERTLSFSFVPQSLAPLDGRQVRLLLTCVPGSVFYDLSRRRILEGVDGVVFVIDSQSSRLEGNRESFDSLAIELAVQERTLEDTPMVLQYNKRDLPDVVSTQELEAIFNARRVPSFDACTHTGQGVFATLRAITREICATDRG